MKKVVRLALAILLSLAASIGYSGTVAKNSEAKPMVRHVILFWLKEPDNPEHVQQAIDGLKLLREIPGVVSMELGTPLPNERNPSDLTFVDSSFHISMVMLLESEQAFAGYVKHPIHDVTVRNRLTPLVAGLKTYDALIID